MIRQIYDWMMSWANHKSGPWVLAIVSYIESSVFILPADPLLIAVAINRPKKAFHYAALTTVFSILGGLTGYYIGYALWDSVSHWFFEYIFSPELFETAAEKYKDNAALALFVAGFTPIPYKVFTIAAGAVKLSLIPFFVGSIAGRSLRFFLLAGVVYMYGDKAKHYIEKHLEKITIITLILLAVFFYFFKM